jgi:L-fuconolactonase
MPAIDAHCHVWRRDDGEALALRDKIPALFRDFTLDELTTLQQRSGVDGAILVQAVDSVAESDRLLALAEREQRVLGVVAWADPVRDDFEAVIGRYQASKRFVGIRPMPHDTFGGGWLRAPQTRRAFAHLERLGCSVDLLVQEGDLDALCELVGPFGRLPSVLDHAGRPCVMAGERGPWRSRMRRLAQCPGLSVKCSGLTERAGVEWTRETIKPWIADMLEIFGDHRVMFASNWPIVTLACRYDLWLDTVSSVLAEVGLSADSQDRVMRHNAITHYGLDRAIH